MVNIVVPRDLHRRLRIEAARRGTSMRRLILAELLESMPALARREIE